MTRKPRRRRDAVSRGPRLEAHEASEANPNARCPDFCFHYTVNGFTVADCDNDAKIALIDAIWERSRLTWAQITTAWRAGMGTEQIPRYRLQESVPPGITDDVTFLALRFGSPRRLIGFRRHSVFHIVWVDPRGLVYPHD